MTDPQRHDRVEAAGNAKAAADPPPYPREWTPNQRVLAYFQAIRTAVPRHTSGWYGLLNQHENRANRIKMIVDNEVLRLMDSDH